VTDILAVPYLSSSAPQLQSAVFVSVNIGPYIFFSGFGEIFNKNTVRNLCWKWLSKEHTWQLQQKVIRC